MLFWGKDPWVDSLTVPAELAFDFFVSWSLRTNPLISCRPSSPASRGKMGRAAQVLQDKRAHADVFPSRTPRKNITKIIRPELFKVILGRG